MFLFLKRNAASLSTQKCTLMLLLQLPTYLQSPARLLSNLTKFDTIHFHSSIIFKHFAQCFGKLFQLASIINLFNIFYNECSPWNFAHDWIRTGDIWCRKQPLIQLSHNHYPTKLLLKIFHHWILPKDLCFLMIIIKFEFGIKAKNTVYLQIREREICYDKNSSPTDFFTSFLNGHTRSLFHLFSSFAHPTNKNCLNFNNINWKKQRLFVWDLNPGLQDERRRQNHGAMAVAQFLKSCWVDLYKQVKPNVYLVK